MTVSGARQHLERAGRATASLEATRAAAPDAHARPAARSRTASPPRATPSSPRRTASSPTSCSATSPTSEPDARRPAVRPAPRRTASRNARAAAGAAARRSRAKVAELARILDEDGYLAVVRAARTATRYRVVEHNCAIWAVAQRYGQACTSEIDFIRAVLPDADVERVQHMVAGARRCAYDVRPVRSDPALARLPRSGRHHIRPFADQISRQKKNRRGGTGRHRGCWRRGSAAAAAPPRGFTTVGFLVALTTSDLRLSSFAAGESLLSRERGGLP